MYLARFSYDFRPADRDRALELIRREVEGATASGLKARMLIPLTRALGGPALQFEVELTSLDQLDSFRQKTAQEGDDWIRDFSQILISPPAVEILRVD
ncbi:MAG TPA: hypothetical protein VFE52_06705, partial [Devosia sp.]|nr:hypothetical protein [Devosia sp.]